MEGSFFKVGEFEVDPRTNQIYRDGAATMLPPRLMDLLCFFASRADEVVTRKEIVDNCWNRTFVTDQVVTQSIFELRKYLRGGRRKGDAVDYIRTVPKRGYQLVAAVTVLPTAAAAEFAASAGVAAPTAVETQPEEEDAPVVTVAQVSKTEEVPVPPQATEEVTTEQTDTPAVVEPAPQAREQGSEESSAKHFLKSLWLNLASLGFKKGAY